MEKDPLALPTKRHTAWEEISIAVSAQNLDCGLFPRSPIRGFNKRLKIVQDGANGGRHYSCVLVDVILEELFFFSKSVKNSQIAAMVCKEDAFQFRLE